jgi:hypothetical protein
MVRGQGVWAAVKGESGSQGVWAAVGSGRCVAYCRAQTQLRPPTTSSIQQRLTRWVVVAISLIFWLITDVPGHETAVAESSTL